MGVSAYNRGSRVVRRSTDDQMGAATERAERQATADDADRLRLRVAELERDLGRARRCIFELRRSKEERLAEARAETSRADAAIRILVRIAFPEDRKVGG